MVPGYINVFKDTKGYIHLYFFKGINNDNDYIYNNINLNSLNIQYDTIKYNEYNIEYIFFISNIKSILCLLVTNVNTKTNITILFDKEGGITYKK